MQEIFFQIARGFSILKWQYLAIFKFRQLRRRLGYWLSAALVSVLLVSLHPQMLLKADAAVTIQTPLSTQGARIVDAKGSPVLLRGINWFGLESSIYVPHGLWVRDYKDMLSQIKSLGYNVIRIPYSVAAMRATAVGGTGSINYSLPGNSELNGKTPLQILDAIVQEANKQGLMILLDGHSLDGTTLPELWYDSKYTEADWINTWTMLADRYKNQANVIGADLKNEPHGQATWGTGDSATDWRLAAERAGNAILAVNPNWLILVEGTDGNVVGQQLPIYDWWGGNLEGVKNYPVRLNVSHKLVYSPHEYGQGVHDQTWFNEANFPDNMLQRWEIGFNYIATQGIAPIWIGEFGGRLVDSSSKEGIWQQKFVSFIKQHNLSFTYWCWNPNSGDTGGILNDDWTTINTDKQKLLSTLLTGGDAIASSNNNTPIPTPTTPPSNSGTTNPQPPATSGTSGTTNPQPSTTPSSNSGTTNPQPPATPPSNSGTANPQPPATPSGNATAQLKVTSQIQSYPQNFCVDLVVTNQGNASTKNWKLNFAINQATLSSAWGGNFVSNKGTYQVTPESWGQVIAPGQSVKLGYCANKTGTKYQPSQLAVSAS